MRSGAVIVGAMLTSSLLMPLPAVAGANPGLAQPSVATGPPALTEHAVAGRRTLSPLQTLPPPYPRPQSGEGNVVLGKGKVGAVGTPRVDVLNGLIAPGISADTVGRCCDPPNNSGAIGPSHYVQMAQSSIAVFNRQLHLVSSASINDFIKRPGTYCDPQVEWDPQARRWLFSLTYCGTFSASPDANGMFFVFGWSKIADPTDLAGGWCVSGASTTTQLVASPRLGYDNDYLTLGYNLFDTTNGAFLTASIIAVPLPASGDTSCTNPPAYGWGHRETPLKHLDGTLAWAPLPANTTSPSYRAFIVSAHVPCSGGPGPVCTATPASKVEVWNIQKLATGPNLYWDGPLTVQPFTRPNFAPQPGTTNVLDTLDARLGQAVAVVDPTYAVPNNLALWTEQTIADPLGSGRSVVRWYEFGLSTNGYTVLQQGNISNSTDFVFNGAIAPSVAGSDATITYNRGGASNLPVIAAQSRRSWMPAGTMAAELVLATSPYPDQSLTCLSPLGPPCRWGLYSALTPDPLIPNVVYGTTELTLLAPDGTGRPQWGTELYALHSSVPPGPPQDVRATASNGSVQLSWLPPADDGGSAITSYTVTPSTNAGGGTPTTFDSPTTTEVVRGLANGTTYTFTVAASNNQGQGPASPPSFQTTPVAAFPSLAVSRRQYTLTASDGVTWSPIDPLNLSLAVTPPSDTLGILSANTDLWTTQAGYNQDLGIAVSGGAYPTVSGQPEAWKESGGFAGTFSPNAAFVQRVIPLKAGTTYTVTLLWKTNKPAPGVTIVAGAGPIGQDFSPTALTLQLVAPAVEPTVPAVSTTQYSLAGSDGVTWNSIDATSSSPLSLDIVVPAAGSLALSGNADLWTAIPGFNQDVGLMVSGGSASAYPTVSGQPEAWKESGGFAGTYSPNAAYVQAVIPVSAGTYHVALVWKANRPSPASIILAGAGPIGSQYSPTVLTARFVPSGMISSAVSRSQYSLNGSDGSTWKDMDAANLKLALTRPGNCVALLSANADLWTTAAGDNQDLGIRVADGSHAESAARIGWKESGGFAGTFSPNAAFAQAAFGLVPNLPYSVLLDWKTNKAAPGQTIVAGAGPIGINFSPTSLAAEIICA